MLDFSRVRSKEITFSKLIAGLGIDDLRRLTDEMIDEMLALIAGCTDDDVTFVPDDPEAYDAAAATEGEIHMSWTLGHVIVHTTASAEESAFLAAELARGAPYHGRSRYEMPWQTVTTIGQCRERLEESRRMRHAMLDVWPRPPHLENTYLPREGAEPVNCVRRFVYGLSHDDSHLGQIAQIVQQARIARAES